MRFKWWLSLGLVLGGILLISCQENNDTREEKYLFFFHNRFLEDHDLTDEHPVYGSMEYPQILARFKEAGFTVISEQR
ncbi:MAG: alpha/beta hydrolase, partial [Bacteroidota bacterium]